MTIKPFPQFKHLSEDELNVMIDGQQLKKKELIKIIWDIDSEIVSLKEEIRRRHPERC